MTTRIIPGGPMKRIARPVHHRAQGTPAPKIIPGGPMKRVPPAPQIIPGGPMKRVSHAKKAKKTRGWSPGIPQCCVAQALADSLEALGRPVDDTAVLDLYWRTARTADAGASILATLEAASEHGLGGHILAGFEEISAGETQRAGLILGMDRPGPHAAYDCAPGIVEEAWAVTWA